MRKQSPSKALWIVVLKNIENLLRDAKACLTACTGVPEVDQQTQGLLAWGMEVNCPFEHVDHMLNSSRGLFGVLVLGQQVLARSSFLVESEDELLSGLVLLRDVVSSQLVCAILAAPDQS